MVESSQMEENIVSLEHDWDAKLACSKFAFNVKKIRHFPLTTASTP